MVGRGGCRHGAARQSPGFPRLTEEVEPALLIDHLQVELLAAVVFGVHPDGIVHHVGRHVVAPVPNAHVTDITGVLGIEKGPAAGVLGDMSPEEERLIDSRANGLVGIQRRRDTTDVSHLYLGLHEEHVGIGDQDLRHIFFVTGEVVVEG